MSEELISHLDVHLRKLRKCDTQATAVAWMTEAYRLMEKSIEALKEKPEQSTVERVIFLPTAPKIEVVQSLPLPTAHRVHNPPIWTRGETVVYEPVPMPPRRPPRTPPSWEPIQDVLGPQRPFNRREMLRLERLQIQKRGR